MQVQSAPSQRTLSLKAPAKKQEPAATHGDQFLPNGRAGRPLSPGEMASLLVPPTVAMTTAYALAQSLPQQLQVAAIVGGAVVGGLAGCALFRTLAKETTEWCQKAVPTLSNSLKTAALSGLAFAGLGLAPLLGSTPGHLPSLATAAAFAAGGAALGAIPCLAVDCGRYLKSKLGN